MKIAFFVCLGLFIADLIGLLILNSSIENLQLLIIRENNQKKRRAFEQARRRSVRATTSPSTYYNRDHLNEADMPSIPANLRTSLTGAANSPMASNPFPTFVQQPAISRQAPLTVGAVSGMGNRPAQQDCMDSAPLFQGHGVLSVVADGMGGLVDSQEVSQRIVSQAISLSNAIRPDNMDMALTSMLNVVTNDVNSMLGPDRLYKSGSTLVAVLATPQNFRWLSVGDSRIYLYRDGYVNQLNQDHCLLQEWMPDILDGKRNYEEASRDPEGKRITSFIGMGSLKYVDKSLLPIAAKPGDRVLLMTDGVYNAITTHQMANILKQYPDVQTAAEMFERAVQAAHIPTQDNYTVQIIAF